jgi:hypothetical protein
MTATCVNPACDEHGVAKHALPGEVYPPGIVIRCGACGEPCDVTAEAPARE